MESSKVSECHIKQMAGDPHATQINLMSTSAQKSQQENRRRENLLSNQNNQVTRMLFMRIPRHQAITRRALILEMHMRI